MKRPPRDRDASILNRGTLLTGGLVGLFMALVLLAMIWYGQERLGNTTIGISMAITTFALFRIVSTFHSRSMTGTVFTVATFDSRQLNIIALVELVLAYLVTQWDVLAGLLETTALSGGQWAFCLVPAILLLLLWDVAKWFARRLQGASVGGG